MVFTKAPSLFTRVLTSPVNYSSRQYSNSIIVIQVFICGNWVLTGRTCQHSCNCTLYERQALLLSFLGFDAIQIGSTGMLFYWFLLTYLDQLIAVKKCVTIAGDEMCTCSLTYQQWMSMTTGIQKSIWAYSIETSSYLNKTIGSGKRLN